MGIRQTRQIEWYKARTGGRPIAAGRFEMGDSCPARGAPDPGDCSLDSARREEFNGIRLEAQALACL